MEYMLLIYDQPGRWGSLAEEERNAEYEEYFALSRELRERKALVSSNELEPESTATTVRVRNGALDLTDGPFAETKEAVGGYYVIDADSLDEAVEWAAKIPSARTGAVEVRPVVTHEAEVSA